MAIFHSTTKIIGRSKGRSSVAAAAYRSGQKLYNAHDGLTHDYRHRSDVVFTEILLPDNAPSKYKNRSTLWNEVEKSENRADSQTAREIELALPVELNRDEEIALIREYVRDNFVSAGMCADVAIHAGHRHRRDVSEADKNIKPDNPHANIMLTTRNVTADGFGKKAREWNNRKNVALWREQWANICNREFERKGLDTRIDHRSYAEQGIDREGSIHLGAEASQMERKGVKTIKGNVNREIERDNMEKEKLQENSGSELRRFYRGQLADLTEMEQVITRYQDKIAELMAREERTNPLKMRENEALDEQIRQFEQSLQQATETLHHEYGIAPEEIADRKAELRRPIDQYRAPEIGQFTPSKEQKPERSREREQGRSR